MLIMSRKPGDTIAIGENVVVRIVAIDGGRVQLGIDAPKDVKIAALEAGKPPESQKK